MDCGRERFFLQVSVLPPAVLPTEKDHFAPTLTVFYTSVEQTMMQYMVLLQRVSFLPCNKHYIGGTWVTFLYRKSGKIFKNLWQHLFCSFGESALNRDTIHWNIL